MHMNEHREMGAHHLPAGIYGFSGGKISDNKGPTEGGKADSTDDKCHHQKELTRDEM